MNNIEPRVTCPLNFSFIRLLLFILYANHKVMWCVYRNFFHSLFLFFDCLYIVRLERISRRMWRAILRNCWWRNDATGTVNWNLCLLFVFMHFVFFWENWCLILIGRQLRFIPLRNREKKHEINRCIYTGVFLMNNVVVNNGPVPVLLCAHCIGQYIHVGAYIIATCIYSNWYIDPIKSCEILWFESSLSSWHVLKSCRTFHRKLWPPIPNIDCDIRMTFFYIYCCTVLKILTFFPMQEKS